MTAEIYGRELSEGAVRIYAADLDEFPEALILTALTRCRRELKTFPAISDILIRIDDGRPGVEEAWAMLPKDEDTSVVWTDEMRDAFGSVRLLLDEDPIAARMAFREIYSKTLADARASRRPIVWMPSLGLDARARESVLREAVEKGRLTQQHVDQFLPAPTPTGLPQLTGPGDSGLDGINALEIIAKIRQQIGGGK